MVNAPEKILIKDWVHFCDVSNQLEGYGQDTNDTVIFRGHRDGAWEKFIPSLYRDILTRKAKSEEIYEIEKALKDAFVGKWFLNEMKPYLEHRALFRMLYIMQHYGIKTRVLDWTLSWKVAAYFATEKKGEDDEEGAVWCVNKTHVENRFRDICQQYDKRSECVGKSIGHNYCWDVTNANKCPVRKPNNQIQCNAIFFKDVLSTSTDVRMMIQASIFTYCPNPLADHLECVAKVLKEDTEKYCKKMIIPPALKPEFRSQLRQSHYTREKLFPVINQDNNKEVFEGIINKFVEEARWEKR